MKEINWLNCTSGGYLKNEQSFIAITNRPPNIYSFNIIKNFDLGKSLPIIKKEFPNDIVVINSRYDSKIEEVDIVYEDFSLATNFIKVYTDEKIYCFEEDQIIVFSLNEFDIETFGKKMIEILPVKEKEECPKVELIAYNQGFYTINSKINYVDIDLKTHYNDDFQSVYDDLKKFICERKSGLAILRGEKGSGKTFLIRHLITNFPAKYVLVTQTIADQITNPEFTTFLLEHKNSVFIVEDCEQILTSRDDMQYSSNGIATILNMSDGLLSDVFNIKFIFTFNADISKIDEALLRKGRCFVNYEFNKLSVEKSNKLLESLGHEPADEELTLAEIYNYEDSDCSNDKESKSKSKSKKIGF